MKLHDTREKRERVILIARTDRSLEETESLLKELAGLADSADCEVLGTLVQRNRDTLPPGQYLGKGKTEELRIMIQEKEATAVLADDELTPVEMRNLTEQLDIKVLDRTTVILDVFARHAVTSEGKIQVELATLSYQMNRLSGVGTSLSRTGGGIGTRGPGEKKLEQDRRTIRHRIHTLQRDLKEMELHRDVTRKEREKKHLPSFAIVGYTNAGKSTLLNRLTGDHLLAEDKLFATLDTATRKMELSGKQQVLVTDTVGLIRKLPHDLIEAFHSTLQEAGYADYLLHVVDASDPDYPEKMETVYQTLDQLAIGGKKIITVLNKVDRTEGEESFIRDRRSVRTVRISAARNQGIEELKSAMSQLIREDRKELNRVFSYRESGLIQKIRENGEMIEEEYLDEGIRIHAYIPEKTWRALASEK